MSTTTILLGCTVVNCKKLHKGQQCKQYVHCDIHTAAFGSGPRCRCGCQAVDHSPAQVAVQLQAVTPSGLQVATTLKAKMSETKMAAVYEDEVGDCESKKIFETKSTCKRPRKEPKKASSSTPPKVYNLCDEKDEEDLDSVKHELFTSSKKSPKKSPKKSTPPQAAGDLPTHSAGSGSLASFWDHPRPEYSQRFAAHAAGAEDGTIGTDADRPVKLKLPGGELFDFRATDQFKHEVHIYHSTDLLLAVRQ